MSEIISAECLGCRGEVGGVGIQCKRIEFGIRISVIRIWEIYWIWQIGIWKINIISLGESCVNCVCKSVREMGGIADDDA